VGLVAVDAFAVAMAARSPVVESLAVIFGQLRPVDSIAQIVNNIDHRARAHMNGRLWMLSTSFLASV
jgi:hypothetical protein